MTTVATDEVAEAKKKYGPKLPEQVVKQNEIIDKALKKRDITPEPGKVVDDPPEPQTGIQPPENTPPELDPAPAQQPQSPPKANAEEVATLQSENAKLKQTLSVLEGKYKHEVPAYAKEVRELKARLEQVEQSKAKEISEAEQRAAQEVRDRFIEEFGEDQVNMVEQMVEQRIKRESNDENPRIAELEQQVATLAQQNYATLLNTLVPDWQSINGLPQFLDWLDKPDPLTGVRRQDLLTDAHNSADAQRVANFFNTFAEETGLERPGSKGKTPQPPRPELSVEVTPSGGSEPVETKKRVYTIAEIKEFYAQLTKPGGWKGTPEQAQAVINDIDLAAKEGRIKQ